MSEDRYFSGTDKLVKCKFFGCRCQLTQTERLYSDYCQDHQQRPENPIMKVLSFPIKKRQK